MATTSSAAKTSRLITPPFRVSFPSVFERSSFNNGALRFSLTGLFFPELFTDKDKAKMQAIVAALNGVAVEKFKKTYKELKTMTGTYKLPFHNGAEKTYEGYGDPKMIYCSMANSKRRPQIIDINGDVIGPENQDRFYAGCWARASVNPYAFDNIGKGLAIGLGNIKKLKDDKSFEGFTSAEDDFSGEEEDFVNDDEDFGGAAEEPAGEDFGV